MIRDEHERLVDRLASGHATPEEETEIRARAKDDPRLARLLSAEHAVVTGLMADKASLPAGAVEPSARLLAALNASTGGISGAVGGSMIIKGIVGGVVSIGLVTGLSLLLGTKEAARPETDRLNVQQQIATPAPPIPPILEAAPTEQPAPESATTLADPGANAPHGTDRSATRAAETRQMKSGRSKDIPVRIKKEKAEGSSSARVWEKATKRGQKSTNSTETSVQGGGRE